tara:strand:+ start:3770 stop:4945 length:1176 start_codon:yes stop_codon:yes gene_type:complete
MKITDLLNEAPKKTTKTTVSKDDDSWVKKADDWVRGSFPMKAIQTMQGVVGTRGPDEKPSIDKKKKIVKKKKVVTKKADPKNKQIQSRNDKINPNNIPSVAGFTQNEVGYQYSKDKDLWIPNNGSQPIQGKQGALMYNKTPDKARYYVKESIITEGGNIFQGTADFDQKIIPDMMKQINGVMTKAGVKALPIGSGATPTPGKMSGDLDMIADAGKLMQKFKSPDVKTAKAELETMFQQAGFETKKTGQIVHVKTTVGDTPQQVDIMVVDNGETASKFHVHDLPKGSPYKGIHKQIMIADLAKEKGFKWSPYKGLVNRDTNELVSNDLENIAKQLIGPNATAGDLGSVESILAKMPSAKEIVDRQEADPNSAWNKKKIQTQENEIVNALRRI